MPHLLQMYWLWLFGAVSLGVGVGWLTYLLATTRWNDRLANIALGAVAFGVLFVTANIVPARYGSRLELGVILAVVGAVGCYLLATSRWNDRPLGIAIGAAAIGGLLAIAKVVPARYGYRLEIGVVLAIFAAIGCFIGWALRDLAEFVPATTRTSATGGPPVSAATTGSYLFRDALSGMGAGPAYLRATTGHGSAARMRTAATTVDAFAKPPARGGYTFPETPPFADATTSRRSEAASGRRRHWTWPA